MMKRIILVLTICLLVGFTYVGYSGSPDTDTKTEAVAGDDNTKKEATNDKEATKSSKSCEKKCPKSSECKKSKSTDDKQ